MRLLRRSRPSRLRARRRRRGRSTPRWALLLAAVALGAVAFSATRRRRAPGGQTPAPSRDRGAWLGDSVPEADWLDQHRDVVAAPAPDRPSADLEAPEADAVEQAAPVGPSEIVDAPSRDPEVPEADALEHAISLPPDDDEISER